MKKIIKKRTTNLVKSEELQSLIDIMNNQVFVPVTDDLIYNHPEQIEGPLIPYSAGMECSEWLSIEINPDESQPEITQEIKVLHGKMIRSATNKKSSANLKVVYSK